MRKLQVLVFALAILVVSWSSTRAALINYRYNSTTQHVYALTDTSQTWANTEAEAVTAGAHLATINNAGENGWVGNTYGGSRWIGFTDQAVEGTWVWSSGTGGTWDYPTWSGTSYTN